MLRLNRRPPSSGNNHDLVESSEKPAEPIDVQNNPAVDAHDVKAQSNPAPSANSLTGNSLTGNSLKGDTAMTTAHEEDVVIAFRQAVEEELRKVQSGVRLE